jgi:hypothetical protein
LPLTECVHPDDAERVKAYSRTKRLAFGPWENIRFRRRRKDGSYIEVESAGSCNVRAPRALAHGARPLGLHAHIWGFAGRPPTRTRVTVLPAQGTHLYGIMRDVSEQHVAEAALRNLLLSSSFDLRIHAQNIQAASALLLVNDAVRNDAEAAFLARAIQSSCNLLLGAHGGAAAACFAWLRLLKLRSSTRAMHTQAWFRTSLRCASWSAAS